MTRPIIIFSNLQNNWELEYLTSKLSDTFIIETIKQVADITETHSCEVLSVFVGDHVDKVLIEKLPNLKLITTRSTGFDHIDLEAAKQKNIIVCNVPNYGDNTVAEHTFALILSLSRKLRHAYLKTLSEDYTLNGLTGCDLREKTLGVIGTGKIGLRVIQIARGFSMHVIAFDMIHNDLMVDILDYKYVDFDTILSESDFITLHAPYNIHTHHLISMDNINKIKKRPFIINTARGGLIETEALIYALDNNIIHGAGLDVIECEEVLLNQEECRLSKECSCEKHKKLIQDKNLLRRDNVIFTPHVAFNSKEAIQRVMNKTIENIQAFYQGKAINIV